MSRIRRLMTRMTGAFVAGAMLWGNGQQAVWTPSNVIKWG